jgi:starch synthase
LESALSRAIHQWYASPDAFRQLAVNAMRADYSWHLPGSEYLRIYEVIRER